MTSSEGQKAFFDAIANYNRLSQTEIQAATGPEGEMIRTIYRRVERFESDNPRDRELLRNHFSQFIEQSQCCHAVCSCCASDSLPLGSEENLICRASEALEAALLAADSQTLLVALLRFQRAITEISLMYGNDKAESAVAKSLLELEPGKKVDPDYISQLLHSYLSDNDVTLQVLAGTAFAVESKGSPQAILSRPYDTSDDPISMVHFDDQKITASTPLPVSVEVLFEMIPVLATPSERLPKLLNRLAEKIQEMPELELEFGEYVIAVLADVPLAQGTMDVMLTDLRLVLLNDQDELQSVYLGMISSVNCDDDVITLDFKYFYPSLQLAVSSVDTDQLALFRHFLPRRTFPSDYGKPIFAIRAALMRHEESIEEPGSVNYYDDSLAALTQNACIQRLATPTEGDFNADYSRSPTYPAAIAVVVPDAWKDVSVAKYQKSIAFRAKGRFPAVTFANNGGFLLRSSQPCCGFFRWECKEEHDLFKFLAERSGAKERRPFVLDARPMSEAEMHRRLGGGTELERLYNCEKEFAGLRGVTYVQEIYTKVKGLATNSDADLARLVRTQHKLVIQRILKYSAWAGRHLAQGISGLVHCKDGWDRTAQLCSLAQLMTSHEARTIDGFARLVEKDWVAFGHQFHLRCAHGAIPGLLAQREMSPVFVQFLDCVHQLLRLYPTAFEFNDEFLKRLARETYSCRYFTFLFDSEKKRAENRLYGPYSQRQNVIRTENTPGTPTRCRVFPRRILRRFRIFTTSDSGICTVTDCF